MFYERQVNAETRAYLNSEYFTTHDFSTR